MKGFSNCVLWSTNRSDPLINQLSKETFDCCQAALPGNGSTTLTLNKKKSRVLRKSSGIYTVIVESSDLDRIKSKKLIESEADIILAAASTIDSAVQRAEGRTRRLLHNLKSLTAKTTQEIYYIAQQDKLLASPRDAVPYVAREIKDNPEDAAKALIEILKHQAAQKAEYTAFDKLSGNLDKNKAERHDVHRVLMNVFYLFFGEFVSKKVRVEVEQTRLQATFDYDSIHVCIYHLIENAAKYVRPRSDLLVTTTEDKSGNLDIRINMESLAIKTNEVDQIFNEGFSGSNAVESKLNGAGIGLFLARAMAQLNGGTLHAIAGQPSSGNLYARNSFILTLPVG